MDGVEGQDDEDGGKGLELDGEVTEGGPSFLGVETCGDADGETGTETLESTSNGGSVVSFELFLCSKLEGWLSVTEYVVNIAVHIPSCCGKDQVRGRWWSRDEL